MIFTLRLVLLVRVGCIAASLRRCRHSLPLFISPSHLPVLSEAADQRLWEGESRLSLEGCGFSVKVACSGSAVAAAARVLPFAVSVFLCPVVTRSLKLGSYFRDSVGTAMIERQRQVALWCNFQK